LKRRFHIRLQQTNVQKPYHNRLQQTGACTAFAASEHANAISQSIAANGVCIAFAANERANDDLQARRVCSKRNANATSQSIAANEACKRLQDFRRKGYLSPRCVIVMLQAAGKTCMPPHGSRDTSADVTYAEIQRRHGKAGQGNDSTQQWLRQLQVSDSYR
jgi:hypothetical protein